MIHSFAQRHPISFAYIVTRVLDTPFWSLFNLIPFILYKEFDASLWELALLTSCKPLVALISPYWTYWAGFTEKKMISRLLWTRCIAFFLFLLIPLYVTKSSLIFAFSLFMCLQGGMVPVWMELLKQDVPPESVKKIFSYTQAFGYLGGGVLPIILGWMLDESARAWIFLFPILACIALLSSWWQSSLRPPLEQKNTSVHYPTPPLLYPWKKSWYLLMERPDFFQFQCAFFLFASGLMMLQPALPLFFIDRLHLSYAAIGFALMVCKGIGFASASPIWLKLLDKITLPKMSAIVACIASCFPILLMGSEWFPNGIYLSYLLYGAMQAGSELSWNLSGSLFSQRQNSIPFTTLNLILVGIRGAIIPWIGAAFLTNLGTLPTMCLSLLLCLASLPVFLFNKTHSPNTQATMTP